MSSWFLALAVVFAELRYAKLKSSRIGGCPCTSLLWLWLCPRSSLHEKMQDRESEELRLPFGIFIRENWCAISNKPTMGISASTRTCPRVLIAPQRTEYLLAYPTSRTRIQAEAVKYDSG